VLLRCLKERSQGLGRAVILRISEGGVWEMGFCGRVMFWWPKTTEIRDQARVSNFSALGVECGKEGMGDGVGGRDCSGA